MAFLSKSGQSFTNRAPMMRADRMADSSKPPAPKPESSKKSVMIQGDGSSFNVTGEGENRQHADIESALRHARSIFGGKSESEDVAAESAGEM